MFLNYKTFYDPLDWRTTIGQKKLIICKTKYGKKLDAVKPFDFG